VEMSERLPFCLGVSGLLSFWLGAETKPPTYAEAPVGVPGPSTQRHGKTL
jgi:hypothetical protein